MNLRKFTVSALAAISCFVGASNHVAFATERAITQKGVVSGDMRLSKLQQKPARIGERNPLVPPFIENFDYTETAHEQFEKNFQVIDANEDNRKWGYYNYHDETRSQCAYLLYPLEEGYLEGYPGRATADDWLIPRAIRLEADRYYHVSVDASLFSGGTESLFEVKMGYYNDPEGMEFDVIPPTSVTSSTRKQVSGWFKATDDGIHYLGVHGISERAKCAPDYLFIDNIAMSAPRTGGEPDFVSDLKFVNDPDGTTALEVSFLIPDKAIDGSPLTGTVDVIIRRGNKELSVITGKAPGERVSFNDNPATEGMVTYSFQARNEAGLGAEYKNSHYAGFVAPERPVYKSLEESGDNSVRFTWEAPKCDLNGNAINPDKLTYYVYDASSDNLEMLKKIDGLTSTEIDFHLNGVRQKGLLLLVSAVLNGKESERVASDIVVVGSPYDFPYSYSFVDENEGDNVLTAKSDDGVTWRMLDDYSNPKPQDFDNGYVCMIGNEPNTYGEMVTGKIDLGKSRNPFVSIYTYVYAEDENEIIVSVIDCDTKKQTEVKTIMLSDYNRVGWTRLIVPITGFAGKTVRIAIGAKIISHGYIPFDNLVVDEMAAVDLGADVISYSSYAFVDEDYTVLANIINTGSETVDNYTVLLLCDDEEVTSAEVTVPLAPLESAEVELKARFSAISAETPRFHVKVEADADENDDNDMSAPFTISFLAPVHPYVKNLHAEESGNSIKLIWSAPDLSKAPPVESFEDFEDYEPFTTQLDNGWTMYDGDKGYVSGYKDVEMPLQDTEQAWWTMTNESPFGFVPTIGNSCLTQMYSYGSDDKPVTNDDWIISPELYGGRQNIGFMARSLTTDFGYETFEVYASSTDNNPSSFTKVKYATELEEEWTQFYISLADGTKYFAVRCISYNCYQMLLDNISYTAKGTPQSYNLLGYNVYCNGVKLNEKPISELSFTDVPESRDDEYFVTALYDCGESVASNVVSLNNPTDVEIVLDDNNAPVEYFTVGGVRISIDNAPAGVYIRRQGRNVEKIVVTR